MTRIRNIGIRSLSLFDTKMYVRFNTFSKMGRLGVAAFNPLKPTDIWIDNNEITMNTLLGEGTGVLVNDNPGLVSSSSLSVSNNIINANDAQNGIAVMNHNHSFRRNNGSIKGNIINMNGNSPERAGIAAFNSRLYIGCNTVIGDANTKNAMNTYGIVAAGGATLGSGSIYQCNQLDKTNVGGFFSGTNDVEFRGNRFDEHETGLLLDANATIGVQRTNLPNGNQELYGNTWTGNTVEDAQNLNVGNIPASRFFIDLSIPNNVPNNFGPTGTYHLHGLRLNLVQIHLIVIPHN